MGWIHLNAEVAYRHDMKLDAVEHAAYIERGKVYNDETGRAVNWTHKDDLAASGFVMGEGAPFWAKKYADNGDHINFWKEYSQKLNAYIEHRYRRQDYSLVVEKQSKAMTDFRMIIALPIELNQQQNIALIGEYIEQTFSYRGVSIQWAMHWEKDNPHVHLQGVTRQLKEDGLGKVFDDFAQFGTRRKRLLEKRLNYAEIGNKHLVAAGYGPRLDHRSYEVQGIEFEPTTHEGFHARSLKADGLPSRIISENEDIRLRNKKRALKEPLSILKMLTTNDATFTERQISQEAFKAVHGDANAYKKLLDDIYKSPELSLIGEDIKGDLRYTFKAIENVERKVIEHIGELSRQGHKVNLKAEIVETILNKKYHFFNDEQKFAVHKMIGGDGLVLVEGKAGTGKTTIMSAVNEILDVHGYNARGFALTGAAAENLERETGFKSQTIDSFEYVHKVTIPNLEYKIKSAKNKSQKVKLQNVLAEVRSKYSLKKHDVIFVDEAGMVGTRKYDFLLSEAERTNSRIRLIGDEGQTKPFDYGNMFGKMKEINPNYVELSEVLRQKESWMKLATASLGEGQIREGVEAYHDKGLIHFSPSSGGNKAYENVINELVADYYSDLKNAPDVSRIALAHSNKDVELINSKVRVKLLSEGKVENDFTFAGKEFGKGDTIVFKKNDNHGREVLNGFYENFDASDNGKEIQYKGVKNGTLATIVDHSYDEKGNLKVVAIIPSQDNRIVHFFPKDHKDISKRNVDFMHGYALTIHSSQGQTFDRAFKLVTPGLSSDMLYVGMTRHREVLNMYVSRNDFDDVNELVNSVSKVGFKLNVEDFKLDKEQKYLRDQVVSFQKSRTEMSKIFDRIIGDQSFDGDIWEHGLWNDYQQKKNIVQAGAVSISNDWDRFSKFVHQSGWTRERVEIEAGHRPRPLSDVQKRDVRAIDQYRFYAQKTNKLFDQIKKESIPKNYCKHRLYTDYVRLRQDRNEYAFGMVEKSQRFKALFLRDDLFDKDSRMSWKAVINQAKIFEKGKVDLVSQHTKIIDDYQKAIADKDYVKRDRLAYGIHKSIKNGLDKARILTLVQAVNIDLKRLEGQAASHRLREGVKKTLELKVPEQAYKQDIVRKLKQHKIKANKFGLSNLLLGDFTKDDGPDFEH